MSGVDTAHAASFVDSEMARVNSPPFIDGAAAASEAFDRLLAEVRACTLCAPHLTHGPRPVLRGRPSARLLIISQAPGVRVHETGISFNDRSGDRLREWLALEPRPVDQGALSRAARRELGRKAAGLGDGPDRLSRQAHTGRELCE